jgi:hypothetical protein
MWRVNSDSLEFQGAFSIPLAYFPLGVNRACSGDGWLLYARNDDQLPRSLASIKSGLEVDFLHRAQFDASDIDIQPIWAADLDPTIYLGSGHTATVIGVAGGRVAVWHRPNHKASGKIVELDCSGATLFTHSEHSLVTGDSLSVLIPRPRPLEWTGGLATIGNGVVVAIHRYFSKLYHGVNESHWKTEIFSFTDGSYRGSMVLSGQWFVMDSHPDLGILVTTAEPVPHFVRFPISSMVASQKE